MVLVLVLRHGAGIGASSSEVRALYLIVRYRDRRRGCEKALRKYRTGEGTVGFWSMTSLPSGTRDEYWNCEGSLPHVEFVVYYDDHNKTRRPSFKDSSCAHVSVDALRHPDPLCRSLVPRSVLHASRAAFIDLAATGANRRLHPKPPQSRSMSVMIP
jgi:hypothetical protein